MKINHDVDWFLVAIIFGLLTIVLTFAVAIYIEATNPDNVTAVFTRECAKIGGVTVWAPVAMPHTERNNMKTERNDAIEVGESLAAIMNDNALDRRAAVRATLAQLSIFMTAADFAVVAQRAGLVIKSHPMTGYTVEDAPGSTKCKYVWIGYSTFTGLINDGQVVAMSEDLSTLDTSQCHRVAGLVPADNYPVGKLFRVADLPHVLSATSAEMRGKRHWWSK